MKMKKFIGAAAAMAVAGVLTVGAAAETYNAYMGFQTTPYSFRNAFDEATYGKDVADGKYFNGVVVWGGNDPETYPEYEDLYDYDIDGYVLPATYTDVVIDKDGTYKVGIADFDWALDGASAFNLLFVSTTIPFDKTLGEDGESIAQFSDAKIIVDGTVALEVAEPVVDTENSRKNGFTTITFANIWNPDIESYAGAYPTSTLEIEFTVSGLPADEPAVDEPTVDEPTTDEPTTDEPTTDEPTTDEPTDEPTTGDSTKPSTDTGVEGVAAVAGVALLAAGAVVIAKKRK